MEDSALDITPPPRRSAEDRIANELLKYCDKSGLKECEFTERDKRIFWPKRKVGGKSRIPESPQGVLEFEIASQQTNGRNLCWNMRGTTISAHPDCKWRNSIGCTIKTRQCFRERKRTPEEIYGPLQLLITVLSTDDFSIAYKLHYTCGAAIKEAPNFHPGYTHKCDSVEAFLSIFPSIQRIQRYCRIIRNNRNIVKCSSSERSPVSPPPIFAFGLEYLIPQSGLFHPRWYYLSSSCFGALRCSLYLWLEVRVAPRPLPGRYISRSGL